MRDKAKKAKELVTHFETSRVIRYEIMEERIHHRAHLVHFNHITLESSGKDVDRRIIQIHMKRIWRVRTLGARNFGSPTRQTIEISYFHVGSQLSAENRTP